MTHMHTMYRLEESNNVACWVTNPTWAFLLKIVGVFYGKFTKIARL